MFLEQAIRNFLVTDPALVAQISTRLYPVTMPQGAVLPALIYSKVSSIPEYSHDGSSGIVESRIQLSCLAATYAEVKTLSANVKRAMRPIEQSPSVVGGANGVYIAGAFLENELDIYEPSEVDRESRFHIPLDYLIQHVEDL